MTPYDNVKVLLGLSAGVNSAAVLCWLIESGAKPSELHIYYAHFEEHSPDSFQFVADGIRLARKHFDQVIVKITSNHVLRYFESQNMIPHPANSPCSKYLKILPINEYAFNNGIKIDLVGYVQHELKRRASRQQKSINPDMFGLDKHYPIGEFTNDWCFEIVTKHIGWYPKIYDLQWDDEGLIKFIQSKLHLLDEYESRKAVKLMGTTKKVFDHNNCLPCKNGYMLDILVIEYFFPEYYKKAMNLSGLLGRYYGRDADKFYTTFGKDIGQENTCPSCKF